MTFLTTDLCLGLVLAVVDVGLLPKAKLAVSFYQARRAAPPTPSLPRSRASAAPLPLR